jgi:sec-independent protein translocase protein TatA
MFGAFGMPELVIVSVIALMVSGPAKFPDLNKSLGAAIRELNKAINDRVECAFERSETQTPLKHTSRL